MALTWQQANDQFIQLQNSLEERSHALERQLENARRFIQKVSTPDINNMKLELLRIEYFCTPERVLLYPGTSTSVPRNEYFCTPERIPLYRN